MHYVGIATTGLACVALTGCHSHFIQTKITNRSAAAINVVQVEYPHASFGTQQLLPGATFQYRFKLLGSGPIKLSYIDARNGEHAQNGPSLNEGQEGELEIIFDRQDHAEFHASVTP